MPPLPFTTPPSPLTTFCEEQLVSTLTVNSFRAFSFLVHPLPLFRYPSVGLSVSWWSQQPSKAKQGEKN